MAAVKKKKAVKKAPKKAVGKKRAAKKTTSASKKKVAKNKAVKKKVAKKKVAKKKVTGKKAVKKKARSKQKSAAKSAGKKRALKKASSKSPKTMDKAGRQNIEDGIGEELVKKIWLAGLGAYGLSRDAFRERSDEMLEAGQQIYDELIERGEKLQGGANQMLEEKIDSMEDRIATIKLQLKKGYDQSAWNQKFNKLVAAVDELQDWRK